MATEDASPYGDVISISSSDESVEDEAYLPKKRPLDNTQDSRVGDISLGRAKRSKREHAASASKSPPSVSSEEGEIDESDENATREAHQSKAGPPSVNMNGSHDSGGSVEISVKPDGNLPENSAPSVFTKNNVTFVLPPLTKSKASSSWKNRIIKWVNAFQSQNSSSTVAITPTLIEAAFFHYIAGSDMKPTAKKSARKAARQVLEKEDTGKQDKANASSSNLATRNEHTAATSSASKIASVDLVSDSEDEYEPTQEVPQLPEDGHHAPGGDTNGTIVLNGSDGHISTNRTQMRCKFCNSSNHSRFACPTRVRCDKCRQLGHDRARCIEKLALTVDEGLACSICDSPNHLEDDCTDIWKSFIANENTIKKVVALGATCSVCGSGLHFSADCSNQVGLANNPMWSLGNRDLYIDPECGIFSIEHESALATGLPTSGAEGLNIRGHASRTINVHYSESDDSETDFIGNKPDPKRAHVGTIRMASNIQMPGSVRGSDIRGQPPLPPGPPPPGPPMHAPPMHSLPPRPPNKDNRGGASLTQGQGSRPPGRVDNGGNPARPSRPDRPRGGHRGGRGARGGRGRGGGRGGRGRGF